MLQNRTKSPMKPGWLTKFFLIAALLSFILTRLAAGSPNTPRVYRVRIGVRNDSPLTTQVKMNCSVTTVHCSVLVMFWPHTYTTIQ